MAPIVWIMAVITSFLYSYEAGGIIEVTKLGLGILFCWWWSHCRDLRIVQNHSILTLEDGTAVGEGSSLVGLLRELALGIGLG